MSAPVLSDYVDLITSEHRDKPKFVALVSMFAQWAVDLRALYAAMPQLFDLDAAEGLQLDALGSWVGAPRTITVEPNAVYPMPAIPYQVDLDDATYRRFIKGRIVGNFWDGSAEGAEPVYVAFFEGTALSAAVVDNLDMSITLYVVGSPLIPAVELAIIAQFLLPVRPAGVLLAGIWVAGGPLFGLDVANQFLNGPDIGYFGTFIPGP